MFFLLVFFFSFFFLVFVKFCGWVEIGGGGGGGGGVEKNILGYIYIYIYIHIYIYTFANWFPFLYKAQHSIYNLITKEQRASTFIMHARCEVEKKKRHVEIHYIIIIWFFDLTCTKVKGTQSSSSFFVYKYSHLCYIVYCGTKNVLHSAAYVDFRAWTFHITAFIFNVIRNLNVLKQCWRGTKWNTMISLRHDLIAACKERLKRK